MSPVDVFTKLKPSDWYNLKAAENASKATGVEYLAYKILGSALVGSLAFALDPLSRIRDYKEKVADINRTQTIHMSPSLISRKRDAVTASWSEFFHYGNVLQGWWGYYRDFFTSTPSTASLTQQDVLVGYIKDTSKRTRKIGQDQGEAEMFLPRFSSGPRSRSWVSSTNRANVSPPSAPYQTVTGTRAFTIGPTAARISGTSFNAMASSEKSHAEATISKQGLHLVEMAMPLRRELSALYAMGELRELPRMLEGRVLSMLEGYKRIRSKRPTKGLSRKDLAKIGGKDYLEWLFGWLPLVRDTIQMIEAPARISKRINYLMARAGTSTTFRSTIKIPGESVSSPPGFVYDLGINESQLSLATSAVRKGRIDCVLNTLVKFPDIQPPLLRQNYLPAMLWGLDLEPEDIYNWIPWTWLIDWFGGVGDYIECFDRVNNDTSIVNWAFFVYDVDVEIKTEFVGRVTRSDTITYNGVGPTTFTNIDGSHTSTAGYKYYLRRKVGSGYGIRPTTELNLFTGDQLAILSSLFAVKASRR